MQMINDTAASICNTVKEAKGRKSDVQIQGDVEAKLGGLIGKFANAGASGKGGMTQQEFEGLSRDAAATALQADRDCRERLFDKMFDRLSGASETSSRATTVERQQATFTAQAPGFDIQGYFRRSGNSVICELTITNRDAARLTFLDNGATIYDENSNVYRSTRVSLASDESGGNYAYAKLVQGLPAKGSIRFDSVPPSIQKIYQLEFSIGALASPSASQPSMSKIEIDHVIPMAR